MSPAEAHDAELALKVAELERLSTARRPWSVKQPIRERLPRRRRSSTFAFRVSDCEGYVTVGEYDDGRPGEVFMKVSKQGSTLAGIMDAFSISISLGLQHGVPLATYVKKYTNMRFEPAGMTDDPDSGSPSLSSTTSSGAWPSIICPTRSARSSGSSPRRSGRS